MRYALFFLLLTSSFGANAQVTCKENAMTNNRFCSSKSERSGESFYFFATDDTGTEANVVFSFGGLISSAHPDGVMVKLDGGTPFKVKATATRPNVNCSRYGGCTWSAGASAEFSQDEFRKMAAAETMLVSYTEGTYVSEPIGANPKHIGAWFEEWTAMTKAAPAGSTAETPPSN